MGAVLGIGFWVGVIVSWFVYYRRAGLGVVKRDKRVDWREFLFPNFGWFAMMFGKCLVWPLVLLWWLVTGAQKSPWKAVTQANGREVRQILRVSKTRGAPSKHLSG